MSNADYRRNMGMDMIPAGRDCAAERYGAEPSVPKSKSPLYMIVDGILLVQEEDGSFRSATAEEYAEIMGDVVT